VYGLGTYEAYCDAGVPMKQGSVYLVGAGPGDPGLLTLRGRQLLQNADVIVYDRLVNPCLLAEASPNAEFIYVGKGPLDHTLTQDAINRLLVEKARHGKTVVRLKGGDPFLFGRGAEEALYLAQHGCSFEIVPGVTSALAAPAYAGIPLTHRDMASSVAVVTGHEQPGKKGSALRWKELAQGVDTLVFLMAIENLAAIAEKLMAHGRAPDTPCALIIRGTTAQQQVIRARLDALATCAREAAAEPPAVLVVGAVTTMREHLAWVEKKPLWGKRVVITRPLPQAISFAEKIASCGGEPVLFPTVSIIKEENLQPLHHAFTNISSYDWVVFTSTNAVDIFFAERAACGLDIRALHGIRFATIGPETRQHVEATGCMVDVMPETYSAEGLLEALRSHLRPGQKVLMPRAANARNVLPEGLQKFGAHVHELPLYRTALPQHRDTAVVQDIQNGAVDILTFTSPSCVRNFITLIGSDLAMRIAAQACVAVIGPVTAAAARAGNLPVSIEAPQYTTDGLLAAILNHCAHQRTTL